MSLLLRLNAYYVVQSVCWNITYKDGKIVEMNGKFRDTSFRTVTQASHQCSLEHFSSTCTSHNVCTIDFSISGWFESVSMDQCVPSDCYALRCADRHHKRTCGQQCIFTLTTNDIHYFAWNNVSTPVGIRRLMVLISYKRRALSNTAVTYNNKSLY